MISPLSQKSWGKRKPPFGMARLLRGIPLTKGIFGCWLFNEGSGVTAYDLTNPNDQGSIDAPVGGNNFTISGGATWVAGPFGWSALNFDGATGQATATWRSVGTSLTFSLCSWFLCPASGTTVILDARSLTNGRGVLLYTTGSTGIGLAQGNAASVAATGATNIFDGRWHFHVCTFDGTNMNYYLDGRLDASASTAVGTFSNVGPTIKMGLAQDGTSHFAGTNSLSMVYNRVLTPSDVNALYLYPFDLLVKPRSWVGYAAASIVAPPNAYVSQLGMLVVDQGTPSARVSQFGMLVVDQSTAKARVSQFGMLVVRTSLPLDFTITTPTTAIGAGTPSRAITITLTGSNLIYSTASFALSDGGVGGIFFPASPVTIPSGSPSGTTTQFVYIAPPTATGTITLQVVGSGGISATHTLTLPIGTSTIFLKDLFTGTLGTALDSHTPDIGLSYLKQANAGTAVWTLTGTGRIYQSVTSGSTGNYVNNAVALLNEFDAQVDWVVLDTTVFAAPWIGSNDSVVTGGVNMYFLLVYNNPTGGGIAGGKFINNTQTTFYGPVNAPITVGTYTGLQAIRSINGNQYIFNFINGTLQSAPTADSSVTTNRKIGMVTNSVSATQTPTNGVQMANLYGRNADWTYTPPSSYPASLLCSV